MFCTRVPSIEILPTLGPEVPEHDLLRGYLEAQGYTIAPFERTICELCDARAPSSPRWTPEAQNAQQREKAKTVRENTRHSPPSEALLGRKDHVNPKILHSGSKAHDKGDARNCGLKDPYAYVVFGAPREKGSGRLLVICMMALVRISTSHLPQGPCNLFVRRGLHECKYDVPTFPKRL